MSAPGRSLLDMTLEFIEYMSGSADTSSWQPTFDWSVEYENEHWWDERQSYHGGDAWFMQVLENGSEVARVEFDDPGAINPNYSGVPGLGGERLEIQYIEVAAAAKCRGIGTLVILALVERHSDRRPFAYSEGADGFWDSLGWEPFYDLRPGPPGRTLFIQPGPVAVTGP